MIKFTSDWFHRISTGWVTLLALVIYLVFMVSVLPEQAAAAEGSAQGGRSPDTSLTYTREDLYSMADNYGEAGRKAYIRARWTFDLIFPLVYTAFLATSISWLFRRSFPETSLWQLVNLIPVLGMIFDFLENSTTTLVFARYPNQTPLVDVLAPTFTLIKWLLVSGSFVTLFLALGILCWRWFRKRFSPAQA